MIKIKVDNNKTKIETHCRNFNELITELTIGIKAVYDGIVDAGDEDDIELFKKFFDGAEIAKPLFLTPEELQEETKKNLSKRRQEIIDMAEKVLVDDEDDVIGKKIVEALKEVLNG